MTRPKIGKNPFQNPVLPDGGVVRPGDRLRRQTRQDPKERTARTTQSSRRTGERDRLALKAGTNKGDPLYKVKVARQEAVEQAAAKERRAHYELMVTAEEQQRLLRLGAEVHEIIEANRKLNLDSDTRLALRMIQPHEWPDGATYTERVTKALDVLNQIRRAERAVRDALAKLFERAGVTERQGQSRRLRRGQPGTSARRRDRHGEERGHPAVERRRRGPETEAQEPEEAVRREVKRPAGSTGQSGLPPYWCRDLHVPGEGTIHTITTETLFERTTAAGLPEGYVRTLIEAGALDGAVTPDQRIRPHGLAAILLVDELARLRLDGRITREEAATVYQTLAPELPDLVDEGGPVTVRAGRRRVKLAFLSRM